MKLQITGNDIKQQNIDPNIQLHTTNDGIELNVNAHFHTSQPLIISYNDALSGVLPTIRINLEAGSKLSLIELFKTPTSINRHSHVTVGKDAELYAQTFALNTGDVDLTTKVHLNSSGAFANVETIAVTTDVEEHNIDVAVINAAPHTKGNIVNYGIVKNEAKLTFKGMGHVSRGNKNADAQQETRILSLSKTAQANAHPFLLIDEGEITAGHAAAIGQLDEEQIYYLMSRGMSKGDASQLIVSGFLNQFVDKVEIEEIKEGILQLIDDKLK